MAANVKVKTRRAGGSSVSVACEHALLFPCCNTMGLPGFDMVSRDCFAGFRATGYNRPQPINANTNAIDAEYEALCAEYAGVLV